VPLLSDWHDAHAVATEAMAEVRALPAHALVEAYSVLTRLPAGLMIPHAAAASVLGRRFPGGTLDLPSAQRDALLATLSRAFVYGGATYDGIVALEAAANGHTLLTFDARAADTYRRLDLDFRLLTP
jgi:hypothetical protein